MSGFKVYEPYDKLMTRVAESIRNPMKGFLATSTPPPPVPAIKSGELIQSSLIDDANLTYYWRFEGNSNDYKGAANGTDTSISYNASYGKFGQGAAFNGADGGSKITLGSGKWDTMTNGTIMFWAYPTASGTWNGANGYTRSPFIEQGNVYEKIAFTDDNKIFLYIYDTNPAVREGTSNSAISLNAWTHVAVTWDGSNAYIYLDGVLDYTWGYSFANMNAGGNGATTQIGQCYGGSFAVFGGYLDDMAKFSRKLSQTEIAGLLDGTL